MLKWYNAIVHTLLKLYVNYSVLSSLNRIRLANFGNKKPTAVEN